MSPTRLLVFLALVTAIYAAPALGGSDRTACAFPPRLALLSRYPGVSSTPSLCGISAPAVGILRFANAGHPPPLLRRGAGTVPRVTDGLTQTLRVTRAPPHREGGPPTPRAPAPG